MAGEADSVSSVSASACHIGGRIGVNGVNPGELVALVYGSHFCILSPVLDVGACAGVEDIGRHIISPIFFAQSLYYIM